MPDACFCPIGVCATLSVAHGSAESLSVAWVLVWLSDVTSGATGVKWDSDLVKMPAREWPQRYLDGESPCWDTPCEDVHCLVEMTSRWDECLSLRDKRGIVSLWAALNMFLFLLCLYRQSDHSPIYGPTSFNKWKLTTWRHFTDHAITHHWSVKCSQWLVK